jgi:hypothetical protein
VASTPAQSAASAKIAMSASTETVTPGTSATDPQTASSTLQKTSMDATGRIRTRAFTPQEEWYRLWYGWSGFSSAMAAAGQGGP